MIMEGWRANLPGDIKSHLEAQIKEVARFKNIYFSERNAQNIQLWIGIAGLSKGIFDLNLKTKFLENALKDISNLSKTTSEKVAEIIKIDFQKEINNTFNNISDINSRLKGFVLLEKDFGSVKERLIELTERLKGFERVVSDVEDIKRLKVGVLDRFKGLDNRVSNIEKSISQYNKRFEKLSKVRIMAVKKKKR